ncbi:MAG TPA: hypothetical protein VNZ64_22850, partial [Candidatus Acidoferrum sp.]|nr:hypothetical protein [Candidatus Acidoferrum sp.]
VVDEFPFGVSEIASVSHPQFAGVSDQKSTVNSENFFGFVEFSNTLLAGGSDNNYAFNFGNGTLTITPARFVTLSIGTNHSLVTGTGDANVTYTVQASSDLSHWDNIGTTTTDENGRFEYQDTEAASFAIRFYRIVLP